MIRRRLLRLLLACVTAFLLAAAALPWWLGSAVRRIGGTRGLKFERYERIGYSRFALTGVEYRNGATHVTAARVEADTPLVAVWRRGDVVIGTWTVDVEKRLEVPDPTRRPWGWVRLRGLLQRIAAQLDRWAPRASAEAGLVHWPGGEIACASARWAEHSLKLGAVAYRGLRADATATFPGTEIRLALRGEHYGADLTSLAEKVKGEVIWWDHRAALDGAYAETGWLPAQATLVVDDWKIPAERLKLADAYGVVRGHGKIEWSATRLKADLAATAEPAAGKNAPPLAVTLRGQGDIEAFTVEALDATLPGIDAHLSEPVTLERTGKFRQTGARFAVETDLAKQPWFAATGTVTGEARWVASFAQTPRVEFQLAAHDVAGTIWAAAALEAAGDFSWPRVTVSHATLAGTAGEKLTGHGGWDFRAKEVVDAAVEGQFRRATLARWLPAEVDFEALSVKAEATGPVTQLKHSGSVRAESLHVAGVKPLAVVVTWAGRGATIDRATVKATAGSTTIAAEGTVGDGAVQVAKLTLEQSGATRLSLTQPATATWRPAVTVEALHLIGPEQALDAALHWGETGGVELTAKGFSSAWLGEFIELPGPAWRVATLAAKGAWGRDPMDYTVNSEVAVELGEGRTAMAAIAAHGDADGLRIEELKVVESGKNVVKAAGRIPMRVNPTAKPKVAFAPDEALALDLTTEPNADFWRQFAALTGCELQEPDASAHVTGTWARPLGTVRVKAAHIAADTARFKHPMPTMDGLDLELTAESGEIRLERMAVTVEGQAARARARLPVGAGKWREFLAGPLAWARRGAEGKIEVPDADVAALARFLPVFIAPVGRVQADVGYAGGELSGSLRLRDAASRPLGPLGVLQEVNADLAFAGRKIELRSVTAQSGGQTVTLSGSIALPDTDFTAKAAGGLAMDRLKFDVALKGENLPFVRQADVLVRGDLDLKLTSSEGGAPLISGTVKLRESLFLSDIRALLPGGARTKSRVPPYFAVETPPYDECRLQLAVQGDHFMKVRTALFNGVASARFQLSGTLGTPQLRGEVTVEEGAVKLPFATFVAQEGRVTLNPEQGVEPQVSFVGTARRLNYDLRMEATGLASAPTLAFSSSPPLESGQVLKMVMAGESPHEELTITDRQRVARLGTFLGQSLLASFGGDSDPGDKLTVVSGETVSRQGRETYGIEYKLTDRWALVGEYDEFDDFNAGVKWRVYSKGGERNGKKP